MTDWRFDLRNDRMEGKEPLDRVNGLVEKRNKESPVQPGEKWPPSIEFDRSTAALRAHGGDSHSDQGVPPEAIARIKSTEDVVTLLAWAQAHKKPIVPVSSASGPRRRGDTLCSRPAVIADLSSMRRVIHVDGENRIAVIEPGVTFEAFDDALRPHGLRAFKPLLPRRGKSVMACHLEREPITSCYDQWDTADPLSALQLVFGNGEEFRTGGAASHGSLEENLARGLRQMVSAGPMATDFTRVVQGAQGSLAIACWGSVYCEPLPPLEDSLFVGSDTLAPLVALLQKTCWRRVSSQLFIVNREQLALMTAGDASRFADVTARLPRWVLFANLTAAPHFPEEHLAYVTADFNADAKAQDLLAVQHLGGLRAADLQARLSQPTDGDYKSKAMGGYRDLCFLSQADRLQPFSEKLHRLAGDRQQPVALYLQPMVHGVSCHVDVTFPCTPSEASTAEALRDQAVELASSHGGFFSRPYPPWGAAAFQKDPGAAQLLATVKQMLDPLNVLNPDRFHVW
jgi:FAD/FMN-containing dehydrogenase